MFGIAITLSPLKKAALGVWTAMPLQLPTHPPSCDGNTYPGLLVG